MHTTDANRECPAYELTDELARFCLPAANRDPNRKLAWTNSICILFLLIGILGSKAARISIPPVPAVEEIIPIVIEPLPPQNSPQEQKQELKPPDRTEAPQVVVVTPEAPNINFSVPTVGNLLVANALAQAPPLNPMEAPAPLKSAPLTLNSTGTGGERPQPPYPPIALEQGEQGTVILRITADEAGNIVSVEVTQSSGFPILDRGALEYVRRHWTLPRGTNARLFETSITYRLQTE